MAEAPPKIPEHLVVRCNFPTPFGPCAFFRTYRVMPKDYEIEGKTPEEIRTYMNKRISSQLLDFYQYHFEKQHEAEAKLIETQVRRVTTKLILTQLGKYIETEQK